MEDIEFEEGEACINQDNDEKIDPDIAFAYIDKRIQDVLGHYQKDFMGGVSAENLGARWGGYGSFLHEASRSPLPPHSISQTQIDARSKPSHYTTSEGLCKKATSQANPPLPSKHEPNTTGCSVRSLPVPVRSSPHGLARGNRQKHLEDHSVSPTKVRPEAGSGKFVTSDMSELYSCLGLVMSPSPSPGNEPPPELVQTSNGMDEMLGNSPSFIVKAMTSFLGPGDLPLSPLPDNLLSLRRKEINMASVAWKKNEEGSSHPGYDSSLKKVGDLISSRKRVVLTETRKINEEDRSHPGYDASLKKDGDPISSRKKVGLTETRNIKQTDDNAHLTGLEKKSHPDSVMSLDVPLKRKDNGGQSKREDTIYMHPPNESGVNIVSINGDNSNKIIKESVSSTKPKNQPNGQEHTTVEQLALQTSQRQIVVDKGKSNYSKEMLHKDKQVLSAMKRDDRCDVNGEMVRSKVTNNLRRQVKCTVEDTLPDSVSSQEYGVHDQRKVTLKLKKVRKENMAYPNGGKGDLGKQKHEDAKQDEPHKSKTHLSGVKSGSDVSYTKDCSSADGKKVSMKKGKNHCQSNTVLPKVSFRVGSSSLLQGQKTDLGTRSSFSSKMDDLKKLDKGCIDSAGINIPKEKKKMTSTKGSAHRVPEGGKHVSRSKSNNKSHNKEPQGASTVRSSQGEDPKDNTLLMQNEPSSHGHAVALPTVPEDWVECTKCKTWRLLPLHLSPADFPENWKCSMLNWLPGMNCCKLPEEQTTEAVRAMYLPVPAAIETKNGQTEASKIASLDTTNVGTCNQAAGSNDVNSSGNKWRYQEVSASSKKNQRKAPEIKDDKKLNVPTSTQMNCAQKIGGIGTVLTGKKRSRIKDAEPVHKKQKKADIMGDLDSNNLLTTDFRKTGVDCQDPAVSNAFAASKKLKDNPEQPSSTSALEMNGLSKKRGMRDLDNDELRQVKKLKFFKGYESQVKESGRNLKSDMNDIGPLDSAHHGSSSHRDDKRAAKSLMGKCKRNISNIEVDSRKLSTKLDMEPRRLDPTSTSSSSKISSKLKGKINKVRCSPVGSNSSSPLKAPRSNHDRTRNLAPGRLELEESLLMKKKAPKLDHESYGVKRGDGKQVHRVYGNGKISSGKSIHGGTGENKLNLEVHGNACKETHHFHKDRQTSSCDNLVSKEQVLWALDGLNQDKSNKENVGFKEIKSKRASQSARSKEHPCSSSQSVDFEAGDGSNTLPLHHSDVGFPKLVTEDLGPSSSGKKDGVDWAAVTALKEAKKLKHSANRMKDSGSGFSTMVFFEAALKFLHGASLLETSDNEGITCDDMKPREVYSTTAKLCQYCAHEFEKSNDLACAALAYKCMETAYMRVLNCCTAVTGRDVQVLRTAERAIPQAASPTSSASDVDNVNNASALEAANSSASRGNIVIPAVDQPSFLRTLELIDYVHYAMDAARKSIGTFEAACLALEEAGNAEGVVSLRRAVNFSFKNIDELLHLVRLAMKEVGGG